MAESSQCRALGEIRNIIVVGKTGCGKSTLANKIIGCVNDKDEAFQVEQSFHSVTREISSQCRSVEIGQSLYSVNMIDTIGFCDAQAKGSKSDSKIITDIEKYLREKAPEGVNLIIFVFRNGRFSEEEKKVFSFISQNLNIYIKEISCLVITGCDGLNEDARKKVISDFQTDALTKEFAADMTQGIFTVGFPKLSNMSERMKEVTILEMQDDIKPIHDLIAESKMMHLHDEVESNAFWRKFTCTIV